MTNALFDLAAGAPDGDTVPVPAGSVELPAGSLLDTLGVELEAVGLGRSRARMTLGPVHLNQRGLPQGGALVTLADAAAGWAAYASLPEGRFTTLELRCSMLGRAAVGQVLVAEARPVHLGRRTLVLEVDVVPADRDTRAVARFGCTQLVLADS